MAKSSKFPNDGRAGDTVGNVPKATREQYMPMGRGKLVSRKTGPSWAPGTKGTGTASGTSTHNNIGAFQGGIKSRGQLKGPSFRSLSNSYQLLQGDPSKRSAFRTPSGGGTGASGALKMGPTVGGVTKFPGKPAAPGNGTISRGKGTGSGTLGK